VVVEEAGTGDTEDTVWWGFAWPFLTALRRRGQS